MNDEIKRESAAGNYYSVRVSNYTLQPLTIINDSNMTFNVVATIMVNYPNRWSSVFQDLIKV
ncbi:MAG: hypothetical protein IPM85_15980 [Chitinophagaceae bacterium]|nr:hypothetical protein [Chitinophagaceae bacterium]